VHDESGVVHDEGSVQASRLGQEEQTSFAGRRPWARERSRSDSSSGQVVTVFRREERPVNEDIFNCMASWSE